ncbi:DNA internalization-related competence protein ComEC/Rec2 [Acinetobacter shaoyimingii]|uniref:DNA internalization-related competence protein ComEC/Rec2 n=2 Tax=Acinetobacter shaoyimingii TaxID=2715164 RepID=A0A6G8RU86_9GAMM|nr:DNA internalization-related competence protein ComEC/Rec2 [Acinetobacter shaoyimingii]
MFGYCILFGWILGISTMGMVLSPKLISMTLWFCLISTGSFLARFIVPNIYKQQFFVLIFHISVLCSSFLLGHYFADHKLNHRLSQRIDQISEQTVLVYINHIDERSSSQEHVSVKQKVTVIAENHQPYDVMLYLKMGPDQKALQLGEYYRVSGKLKPTHSYAVDGVFDQEKWFIQQNIMGTMQIRDVQQLTVEDRLMLNYSVFAKQQKKIFNRIKLYAEKHRLKFRNFIQRQAFENKGLLLGLLTGDESLLSKTTQDQFKTLGIAHLLAISGPHVLIFAVIVCFVLNMVVTTFIPKVFLRLPRPYLLLLPFLFCVLIYTAFVGFEIPAMRTCLTVFIISLLLIFKQQINALKLLLCSASILLLIDPFGILSAAFWLSYGACFILIRVYQTVVQEPQTPAQTHQTELSVWKSKLSKFLYVLFDSQWKIFIALFPLVAIIFQQVSWIAPLVNLIAIPIIGIFVVPFEIVGACLSGWIEPLSLVFFYIADWSLSFLNFCLNTLQKIFNPQLNWLALTPWKIALLGLGIFILFMPNGTLPKGWVVICVLLIFMTTPPAKFELTVLDVGQGQAIFLQLPNQNMLIDTGGSFDEDKFSIGHNIITPYLMKKGITKLDKVVLTHLDQDHAGAFEYVANHIKIKHVISNQQDKRFDAMNFEYCSAGQHWNFDGVQIQVLSPDEDQLDEVHTNQNERSCVLYIQVPEAEQYRNFLLMGDAGWETEFQLLQQYPDLSVDVLILGHHGSQHSSSYDFLQRLNPQLTIASAGFDNRYNHPSGIVQARLAALSIPFESTIEKGSIQFKLNNHRVMQKKSFRESKRWFIRSS